MRISILKSSLAIVMDWIKPFSRLYPPPACSFVGNDQQVAIWITHPTFTLFHRLTLSSANASETESNATNPSSESIEPSEHNLQTQMISENMKSITMSMSSARSFSEQKGKTLWLDFDQQQIGNEVKPFAYDVVSDFPLLQADISDHLVPTSFSSWVPWMLQHAKRVESTYPFLDHVGIHRASFGGYFFQTNGTHYHRMNVYAFPMLPTGIWGIPKDVFAAFGRFLDSSPRAHWCSSEKSLEDGSIQFGAWSEHRHFFFRIENMPFSVNQHPELWLRSQLEEAKQCAQIAFETTPVTVKKNKKETIEWKTPGYHVEKQLRRIRKEEDEDGNAWYRIQFETKNNQGVNEVHASIRHHQESKWSWKGQITTAMRVFGQVDHLEWNAKDVVGFFRNIPTMERMNHWFNHRAWIMNCPVYERNELVMDCVSLMHGIQTENNKAPA